MEGIKLGVKRIPFGSVTPSHRTEPTAGPDLQGCARESTLCFPSRWAEGPLPSRLSTKAREEATRATGHTCLRGPLNGKDNLQKLRLLCELQTRRWKFSRKWKNTNETGKQTTSESGELASECDYFDTTWRARWSWIFTATDQWRLHNQGFGWKYTLAAWKMECVHSTR